MRAQPPVCRQVPLLFLLFDLNKNSRVSTDFSQIATAKFFENSFRVPWVVVRGRTSGGQISVSILVLKHPPAGSTVSTINFSRPQTGSNSCPTMSCRNAFEVLES